MLAAPAEAFLRDLRVALLVVAAAALLMTGWLAAGAQAGHAPETTLHVCATDRGAVRVSEDCRGNERAHVLLTEAGLQAAGGRIDALEERVAELEAQNAELAALLEGAERTEVEGHDTLRLSGMNLQVVNGEGATDTSNGLGNVLIGYSAQRDTEGPIFSEEADRGGSHYIVVGDEHEWTAYGGLIAGVGNTAAGPAASVTGGRFNTASGAHASVTGGDGNAATGEGASVAGGRFNDADGLNASIAGGLSNLASDQWTSVSGGVGNTASGNGAWASGGFLNEASGGRASVSGGLRNTAEGRFSSILGGREKTVTGEERCHPGC